MYVNDLGMGRTTSVDHNNSVITGNTSGGKNTNRYAAVMKEAVDNQKTSVTPTFASAGDVIIKEAFDKMKTDPEWEESVMNKVKEYYAGNYTAGGAQTSYLNWMSQNSLQNYMLQSLIGGQSSLGMGLTGYSPYGFGSLAASAYGNMMSGSLGSSLFGSWQL